VTNVSKERETNQWILDVRCKSNPKLKVRADAIFVCSGLNAKVRFPTISGLNSFRGEKLHAIDYRTPDEFQGKRVLVVGSRNTASDMAVELTKSAGKVYLSTRRGFYRVSPSVHLEWETSTRPVAQADPTLCLLAGSLDFSIKLLQVVDEILL